jgi:NADH-quinone oxidoreductase subunit I
VFAITATNRFTELLLNRDQLSKSNAYYHQIHPVEAAEVDARLAAERLAAEEKAKAAAAAKAAAVAKPPVPPPGATPAAAAEPQTPPATP